MPRTEPDMELMVCSDGVEIESFVLEGNGDDPTTDAVEYRALSLAYELKMGNPEAVVTVVIVDKPIDRFEALGALQVGLGY